MSANVHRTPREILLYASRMALALVCLLAGCSRMGAGSLPGATVDDSARIMHLLGQSDSITRHRRHASSIADNLPYLDTAYRLAQDCADTPLQALTLLCMGNAYDAYNDEPYTSAHYYQQAARLYATLPAHYADAFYARYKLAHAYDCEKANDTAQCLRTLKAAYNDLLFMPEERRRNMDFLSEFGWVATNAGAYTLAAQFLQGIAPRSSLAHAPFASAYLGHYWLAWARIELLGQKQNASAYLDSVALACTQAQSPTEAGYFAAELGKLYECAQNPAKALYYTRQSERMLKHNGQNELMRWLRTDNFTSHSLARQEAALRVQQETRYQYALAAGLALIGVFIWWLYRKHRAQKTDAETLLGHRHFIHQLLRREEEQRRRMAAELYDGVNHELLTLKHHLVLGKPLAPAQIEQIINMVRQRSRDLYPALFETVGLEASLQSLCEQFTQQGLFTSCDVEYHPYLDASQELQLYRIIEEALYNVARHARADAARVVVKLTSTQLYAEVKDNGRGFTLPLPHELPKTIGLLSMHHRAIDIGAHLHISSSHTGTIVSVTKPVKHPWKPSI